MASGKSSNATVPQEDTWVRPAKRTGGGWQAPNALAATPTVDHRAAGSGLLPQDRHWHAVFDAMSQGVCLLDRDHRILRCNRAMAALVGKPAAEMLGATCHSLIHGLPLPLPDCPVSRMAVTRQTERLELDLGGRWLEVTANPLLDEAGEVAGAVHILVDITERKRAEVEREKLQALLNQARKMESVGRLAGGVAHDFRNLLMGIMSYVVLCQDELGPDHPVRTYLDEIMADAKRSAELISQLLAFARKQVLAPRTLDLNDKVASTLTLLRRLIGGDINLAWVPSPGLWSVKMDASQVDQVLLNLTANARDAIQGVGTLTIGTRNVVLDPAFCSRQEDTPPGEYVLLTVSDTGRGMAPEDLAHLFDPFFTTKPAGKGTGLGLATVYGVVKQNRGCIEVDTEPGKGTTFRIYLPRDTGRPVEDHSPSLTPVRQPGRETVLLVADAPSIRLTAQRFLEELGYTVLIAPEPETAQALAGTHPGTIHLLLTDVVLPGINGRDLARSLSVTRPGLKCLYISGYPPDELARRGAIEGQFMLLAKRFTPDELARKVREVLDA